MERENDGLPISSLREIKLLKTLRHDNVVLVKEVAVGNDLDQIFLVMEYCEQDMAALMDNVKKPYTPAEVKCLMLQLLKGIEYCHDHFVIHRDLKLSNLLLNSQGILKIADFGLARSFGLPSRPMTPKVVTLWYRAPELLFGDLNYTTAVDMWSAGCIFGELLKHAPLLPGKVEKQQVDLIIDLLGTPHEKIWQGFNKLPMSTIKLPEQRFNNLKNKFPHITDAARSLLSGLLTYDPKKRLSVKQALAHPYFFELPHPKHASLLPTHPEIRNIQITRPGTYNVRNSLTLLSNKVTQASPPESLLTHRTRSWSSSSMSMSPTVFPNQQHSLTTKGADTIPHQTFFGTIPVVVARKSAFATTTATSNTHVSNNNGSSSSDTNVPGDSYPYPYSDPDFLDFEQCKNPVQLEKSVASYLKSHPVPTDQALVAMLTACANLCRAAMSPSPSKTTHHPRKQHQQHQQHTRLPKDKRKPETNKASTTLAPPNLLETILQSSMFSSDQVFKIAHSIHNDLSTRPHSESGIIQDLPSRQRTSSLQVTNAFLNICAITGHFNEAEAVLQEMLDSPQGDVKPDLTTYRHVLRAAAVAQRHQYTVARQDQDQDQARRSSIDASVQEVIEHASEALSKKARMAFWIKLGLGGLTGATVGKFTMMAIMALPISRPLEDGVERNSGESTSTHMIDSLQPTEGIMEFLATQEVATGIGLAVGMLTAGYFILGSTCRPLATVATQQTSAATSTTAHAQELAVDEVVGEPRTKSRHDHHHHRHLPDTLPRAKLFGLYFPDLATTSKDEVRDYLQRSMQS
ncbi:Cyclin-dependent kinase 10 [Linnemannia hyalina]|uniref:Cyclin-dependent kinase 10 n=1 Tax=Linnemannia hyalina TaxID=64524 RepID=A0A9P7Y5B7_9FUNG|nr:Cyclin-dependent kinase 10 [Linnemannia hyalina]